MYVPHEVTFHTCAIPVYTYISIIRFNDHDCEKQNQYSSSVFSCCKALQKQHTEYR